MSQWRKANTGLQRYPRQATAVSVRVSTVDAEIDPNSGSPFYRSSEETTANLSHGGAFVRSWEPLAAGRRVLLNVDLPNAEDASWPATLQLEARVVWTQRAIRASRSGAPETPGYGVEFTSSGRAELAALDRYLNSLTPSQGATASKPTPAPITAQP